MFSYKFQIDTRRNSTLSLRISNNRKSKYISLSLKWSEEELEDAMSAHPKPENKDKQLYLQARILILDRLKIELQEDNRALESVDVIRDIIMERFFGDIRIIEEKKKQGTFIKFFQQHILKYDKRSTRESNEYTISTMRKAYENIDELDFEDINYAWLADFEIWMKRRGLSQNTRKIHFGNIRTVMREAYKRELTDADPFRRFTFKPAKTRKRSMNVGLLRELFDYPVEPYAEIYRDMFKLMFFFVGINSVDLYNLKYMTSDGRIEYSRSKTEGLFSLKVEPEAMEIIKKYRGKNNLLVLADRWSDYRNFRHQMNSAIQRIGKSQGQGKKEKKDDGKFAEITSYWARHTWATIAYEIGIPDDIISQALGHQGTGAKVTDVYIRRSMDKVDEANRKVIDWVLYGKR